MWISAPQRIEGEWGNVEYFYDRFEGVFHEIPVNALYEEFCDYQSPVDGGISGDVWQAA